MDTTVEVDLHDIMSSLSTLIKYTPQSNGNDVKKRQIALIAIVGESTPISLIRNIMLMPTVDHVSLKEGGSITYNDVKSDVEMYVNNVYQSNKILKKLTRVNKHAAPISNRITLTPRQEQILYLVTSRGASNKVIARMLNLSESTVKLHLGLIFKKYGVKNRTQLAVSAIEITHKETLHV